MKYQGLQTIWTISPFSVYNLSDEYIKSVDFSHSGDNVLVSQQTHLMLYECVRTTNRRNAEEKLIHSAKYGVRLVRFLYEENECVHSCRATSQHGHHLRLLDINNLKYLHYFKGHTETITSVCKSPSNVNNILSTAEDKTVVVWDKRLRGTPACQVQCDRGMMPVDGKFDPPGIVVAVLHSNGLIGMYDSRYIAAGKTFANFQLDLTCPWTSLEYHPLGKQLLASAISPSRHTLIDAFSGNLEKEFGNFQNHKQVPMKPSFCPPSGSYVLGGSDHYLHIWDANSGVEELSIFVQQHPFTMRSVYFNPKYPMFITTGQKCVFWKWKLSY